jgi:hypothetical protein
MSHYYFAFDPTDSELREFRMRGVFVGVLFAVGSFLILYRGFSTTENIALSLAGLCALLVALIPMATPPYCNNCGANDFASWHYYIAIILFVCVAFVAVVCGEETLRYLDETTRNRFRICYDLIAVLMIVLPALAFVVSRSLGSSKTLLAVEATGIWTFSAYWFVKTWELYISQGDQKAMKGEMPSPTPEKKDSWDAKTFKARRLVFEPTERFNKKMAAEARATAAGSAALVRDAFKTMKARVGNRGR